MHRGGGFAVDRVTGIVVVHEAAHAEALVVRNAVTVPDADAAVRDAEAVLGVLEVERERVVDAVRILIRTLEEVHTDGRRVFAVSIGTAVLIVGVSIVAVSETTLDVTTDIVVVVAAEVGVDPRAEVGVRQRLRALVDEHVVVERHVVDLVVGAERECLGTDLHADGLALGLGVHIALVVEDPVEVLVAVQRHRVLAAAVLAVDFLQEVVPGVVTE